MGVEKFLDASTGHITYEDSLKLLEDPSAFPSRVIVHDYGWWINIKGKEFEDEVILAMRTRGYSEAFVRLMRLAYTQECWWINLDCDGDDIDGLEIIEW